MKRLAFFSLTLLLASSTTSAAIITDVTSSDLSVATVSLASESSTPQTGFGGSDVSATLELDVTILQKHVPVEFIFTVDEDDSAGTGGVFRRYAVTLNVTNSLPTGGSRDYINGFDITNGDEGVFTAGLDPNTEPSGYFAFEDGPPPTEYNQPGGFRFGGLNGGGPAMYNGDPVRTQFFSYVISGPNNISGTTTLSFTANPEPGTLALAGLALFPLGIAVRRRRKAAQPTEEV